MVPAALMVAAFVITGCVGFGPGEEDGGSSQPAPDALRGNIIVFGDAVREYPLPDDSGETMFLAITNDGTVPRTATPCLYRNGDPINCWTVSLAPGQVEELEWYRTPDVQAGNYRFLGHQVRIEVADRPDWKVVQSDEYLRYAIDEVVEAQGPHGESYVVINSTVSLLSSGHEIEVAGDHSWGTGSPPSCTGDSNTETFAADASVGSTVQLTSCQRASEQDIDYGMIGRINYPCSEFRDDHPGWVGKCPKTNVRAGWTLPAAE